MNKLQLSGNLGSHSLALESINQFFYDIIEELNWEGREVSIKFSDPLEIAQLNRQFRSIDGPTDVLSFVEADVSLPFLSSQVTLQYMGDIIICLDKVAENASAYNVAFTNEVSRVIIHGILHLEGLNHETNDPAEPMLIKQEEILTVLTKKGKTIV